MPDITANSTGARPEIRIGGGELVMQEVRITPDKATPKAIAKDQFVKAEVKPFLKDNPVGAPNKLWAPKK